MGFIKILLDDFISFIISIHLLLDITCNKKNIFFFFFFCFSIKNKKNVLRAGGLKGYIYRRPGDSHGERGEGGLPWCRPAWCWPLPGCRGGSNPPPTQSRSHSHPMYWAVESSSPAQSFCLLSSISMALLLPANILGQLSTLYRNNSHQRMTIYFKKKYHFVVNRSY